MDIERLLSLLQSTDLIVTFCSYAVSEGRRREHAHEGDAESIPDPEAESSFLNSKLMWEESREGHHAESSRNVVCRHPACRLAIAEENSDSSVRQIR